MDLDISSFYQYLQQITKNTSAFSIQNSSSDSDFSFELSLQAMMQASAPAYAKLSSLALSKSEDGESAAAETDVTVSQTDNSRAAAASALLMLSQTASSFLSPFSGSAELNAADYSPYRMQELLFQMLNNESEVDTDFNPLNTEESDSASSTLQSYINQLLIG